MKKLIAAAVLAACGLALPLAAGAQVPEGSAHIAGSVYDLEDGGEEWSSSSYLSSSSGEGTEESTFYVNDGVGRLAEFHMTRSGDVMSLTIRENGAIMWKGSCHVKQNTFSVARREQMGEVWFEIHMGEHTYHASIDKNDRWNVEEGNGKDAAKPVPLTAG